MPLPQSNPAAYQAQFHYRWDHLRDPHARSLAWLIDAPDLLDPAAAQWSGKIASLPPLSADLVSWLEAIDRHPCDLHAWLKAPVFTRLGRYAEKLMAFYFQHCGNLFAHGVQVRAGKNDTVGEFDFLLRRGAGLLHLEFATKFYLFEPSGAAGTAGYFVGPNLADTLGAKLRKIFDRQLTLAQHPAAQMHLPLPVDAAQALIKGWLFYPECDKTQASAPGLSGEHCRGFWCTPAGLGQGAGMRWALLPRMQWLAPARLAAEKTMSRDALQDAMNTHFLQDSMPLMVVALEEDGEFAREASRGFVVPDDWQDRARSRISGIMPA